MKKVDNFQDLGKLLANTSEKNPQKGGGLGKGGGNDNENSEKKSKKVFQPTKNETLVKQRPLTPSEQMLEKRLTFEIVGRGTLQLKAGETFFADRTPEERAQNKSSKEKIVIKGTDGDDTIVVDHGVWNGERYIFKSGQKIAKKDFGDFITKNNIFIRHDRFVRDVKPVPKKFELKQVISAEADVQEILNSAKYVIEKSGLEIAKQQELVKNFDEEKKKEEKDYSRNLKFAQFQPEKDYLQKVFFRKKDQQLKELLKKENLIFKEHLPDFVKKPSDVLRLEIDDLVTLLFELKKEKNSEETIKRYRSVLQNKKQDYEKLLVPEKRHASNILAEVDSDIETMLSISGGKLTKGVSDSFKARKNIIKQFPGDVIDQEQASSWNTFIRAPKEKARQEFFKKQSVDATTEEKNKENPAETFVDESAGKIKTTENTPGVILDNAQYNPFVFSPEQKVAFIEAHTSLELANYADKESDGMDDMIAAYENNRNKIAQMVADGLSVKDLLKEERYTSSDYANPVRALKCVEQLSEEYALKIPDAFIAETKAAAQIKLEEQKLKKEVDAVAFTPELSMAIYENLEAQGFDLSAIPLSQWPRTQDEWNAVLVELEQLENQTEQPEVADEVGVSKLAQAQKLIDSINNPEGSAYSQEDEDADDQLIVKIEEDTKERSAREKIENEESEELKTDLARELKYIKKPINIFEAEEVFGRLTIIDTKTGSKYRINRIYNKGISDSDGSLQCELKAIEINGSPVDGHTITSNQPIEQFIAELKNPDGKYKLKEKKLPRNTNPNPVELLG